MKVSEILAHPVESFRTAPIALLGVAASSGMSALMIEVASDVQGSDEVLTLGTAGFTAALALRGIYLTSRSFKLRDRLENSLATNGFNDRIFATTTPDWCTRQTALVACEQFDKASDYQALCEQYEDQSKFTSIPQI